MKRHGGFDPNQCLADGTSNVCRRRRMTMTNQRRTLAKDEPVVPLVVPKPEEDKDDEVGILDVPPGFVPCDGHA